MDCEIYDAAFTVIENVLYTKTYWVINFFFCTFLKKNLILFYLPVMNR